MAPRRRGRRHSVLTRLKPTHPTLDISRQEIAARELRVACKLLFEGSDPIAIYVLAMAAFHVSEGEAKRLGRPTPWTVYVSELPSEWRDEYYDIMLGHFNVMKHGGKGGLQHFMPDAVPIYVVLAMAAYWAAFDTKPDDMDALLEWTADKPADAFRLKLPQL